MTEVFAALAGLAVGVGLTFVFLKMAGGQALRAARAEADAIVSKAKSEGETVAKQVELDARNAQAERREALEKELSKERDEIDEQRRAVAKREDTFERKLDMLAMKEKTASEAVEQAKREQQEIAGKREELDGLIAKRKQALEDFEEEKRQELSRIAHLPEEEAKRQMLEILESQCRQESGKLIQKIRTEAEEEARDESLKITLAALQRYAGEHTAVSVTNSVPLPSDELKGRIIGREGRNIRAFETATGVDVVVDDTPGSVTVSCFDPVRRAMAAEALRTL
ncbi:MAG: Rnase Y domain-containing protein, partial [Planctomycetota bacterium]